MPCQAIGNDARSQMGKTLFKKGTRLPSSLLCICRLQRGSRLAVLCRSSSSWYVHSAAIPEHRCQALSDRLGTHERDTQR